MNDAYASAVLILSACIVTKPINLHYTADIRHPIKISSSSVRRLTMVGRVSLLLPKISAQFDIQIKNADFDRFQLSLIGS